MSILFQLNQICFQQTRYNAMMIEKDEEERKEIELKLQEIQENRSAKIIQKHWRKYLKQKSKNVEAKRKGGKDGKRRKK